MKRLTVALAVGVVMTFSGARAQQFSGWSEPVSLGPVVNSSEVDQHPAISSDGLSLYFSSNRPGGFGGTDLYVSQRATLDAPWGPAINLGPGINSAFAEATPSLSPDEHRLYFFSARLDGFGASDIYVSRRHNKRDDFAWQPAENLGAPINSAAGELGAVIFEDDVTGEITMYFSRRGDIYASVLQPDETWGAPVPVESLNSPSIDSHRTIRRDGLEMVLCSDRAGTFGFNDLWVSTRATTQDTWSTPTHLTAISSPFIECVGSFSKDATELYFGRGDLLVSTRTKLSE